MDKIHVIKGKPQTSTMLPPPAEKKWTNGILRTDFKMSQMWYRYWDSGWRWPGDDISSKWVKTSNLNSFQYDSCLMKFIEKWWWAKKTMASSIHTPSSARYIQRGAKFSHGVNTVWVLYFHFSWKSFKLVTYLCTPDSAGWTSNISAWSSAII